MVCGLSKTHKLNCFFSGLREKLWVLIQMHNPPNLVGASGLARMQEENLQVIR